MTDEQEPAWAAEDGRIVDLAIDLRSVLTDLMGDDAFRIDRTLDDLIAQALAGHNVAAQIAATLRSHELTSRWLDLALAGSSEEANRQLLGKPARAPADGGRFGGTRGLGDRGDWTADRGVGVDPEPGGGDLGGSDGPAATRGIDFDRFDPGPGPRAEPPERAAVAPPTAPAAAAPPTAPAGAAPGPPDAAPAPGDDEPPTPGPSSYALIDCPDVVVAGVEFDLAVGLSDAPADGVVSDGPLKVPDKAFSLTIDIHAEGFTVRDGESLRQKVRVTSTKRYPRLPVHLMPDEQAEPFKRRTISASFAVNGQVVSLASRFVIVMAAVANVADAPAPEPMRGVDVRVPTAAVAPDLTARILTNRDRPGTYSLVLVSPWEARVAIPAGQYDLDVGDARGFLGDLVEAISLAEQPLANGGDPHVYDELAGQGAQIAAILPRAFWTTLAAVASVVQGTPSVLFLTQEPFLPWELAWMSAPLDPAAPPFLGAQANVARWILGADVPVQPPPPERTVTAMAVVVGDYTGSGWEPLPQAEDEANELATSFGAMRVDARFDDVKQLLRGQPDAQVIHFATHGQYDDGGTANGLIMIDGEIFNTSKVRAQQPLRNPFVFLNACQVGAGNKVLAGASGLAAEFVNAGASGVVAPLWSVNDKIAREIAGAFYAAVLGAPGISPAEALRQARQKFREDPAASPTYLAYQFFGAPNMRLVRGAPPAPGAGSG